MRIGAGLMQRSLRQPHLDPRQGQSLQQSTAAEACTGSLCAGHDHMVKTVQEQARQHDQQQTAVTHISRTRAWADLDCVADQGQRIRRLAVATQQQWPPLEHNLLGILLYTRASTPMTASTFIPVDLLLLFTDNVRHALRPSPRHRKKVRPTAIARNYSISSLFEFDDQLATCLRLST
jgi:hypothetical protein